MIEPDIAALSMLHKIGPTNRSELVGLINELNLTMINKMERTGYVKRHFGDADMISVTNAGLKKVGIVDKRITPSRKIDVVNDEDKFYKGLELRPYTGRPNCNDAMALPSRHFNDLHYRDGRKATL